MEAVHFTKENLTERFEFKQSHKRIVFGLLGLGIVLVILGFLFPGSSEAAHTAGEGHEAHGNPVLTHALANFLTAGLYFLTIAMGAMFFLAVHRVGNAGWQTAIRRVPEAMTNYIFVGAIGLALLFPFLGSLYEWAILDVGMDALIDEKRAYLNEPFFIARSVVIFLVWIGAATWLRRLSKAQDEEGGLSHFSKMGVISAVYIIFFAISYTAFSVDWIKSLEPHWYSTIFMVYIFSGSMVSGMVVIFLTTAWLQKQGYMSYVNEAHLHDIGKYAFGFSVFWGYIWISQYLLQWYSNIPEESIYYVKRYRVGDHFYLGYAGFFYINIFLNFIIPFLALMMRNSKRTIKAFLPVAVILLYGHWHDLFLMVMPGAVGENPGIGFFEIGFFAFFAGLFLFILLRSLSKANLVPVNHPYLEESLHHSTGAV